jgi:hypothetical protein
MDGWGLGHFFRQDADDCLMVEVMSLSLKETDIFFLS